MWSNRIVGYGSESPEQLLGNPLNFRIHPGAQQNALGGVLNEVGFVQGVIVNRRTGEEWPDGQRGVETMVDGHLRAQMAISKGQNEIPVVYVDLSPNEEAKVLATFDKIGELAGADPQALDALLREIETGEEALQELLAEMAEDAGLEYMAADEAPEDPGAQIDRAEELREQWGTETGQLWEITGPSGMVHRLLCGDSTKKEDVERVMGGETPFIMVTDPPYGVEYDSDWRDEFNSWGKAATNRDVANDDRVDWTDSYKLFPGRVAYVWHDGRHAADLVVNLRDAGFECRSQIIWKKPRFAMSRGHYHWQHEPCWYAVRKGSSKWCGDRTQSTIWEIDGMHAIDRKEHRQPHGTQKPIECMARPIRNHGDKDDDIYDPFLNSGTTMVAAEQLSRRCFGIEISSAYCAVILQRMKDLGCECVKSGVPNG